MSRSKLIRNVAVVALAVVGASASAQTPQQKAANQIIVVFKAGATYAQRAAALRQLGLTSLEHLDALNLSIAKKQTKPAMSAMSLDATFGGSGVASAQPAAKPDAVVAVEQDFYTNWLKFDDVPSSDFNTEDIMGQAHALLAAAPNVAHQSATPALNVPWGVDRVGAPKVWTKSKGAGVKVAVIDTGISCSHPDLQCDLKSGFNATSATALPDDDNGHGTHVSGTIAGRGTGTGVIGVAPGVTLIPVKVLDSNGNGTVSDVVRGIEWAADHGANVINMSLGSSKGSAALQQAIETAYNKGITIVAAAGNDGPTANTVNYPGAYPQVIAVAASDKNDNIADFSSRGDQVAFTAPGVDILSTVPGGGYELMSGTSMATPHMTGLAALAIAGGASGPEAVRAALSKGATRLCKINLCPMPDMEGAGLVTANLLPEYSGMSTAHGMMMASVASFTTAN